MKRTLLFLLLVIPALTTAQDYVDLLQIQHAGIPRGMAINTQELGSPYIESTIDATLPIVLDQRAAFITGLNLERTVIESESTKMAETYAGILKLGFNFKHNERLSASYLLLPRLSYANPIFTQKIQFGGLVLMKSKVRSSFHLKWGVYWNQECFGPLLVPLAGVYVKKERWEMNLALPINGEVMYDLNQKSYRIGMRFDGVNRSYTALENKAYLEKRNNEFTFILERSIYNWLLRLHLGHSVARKFDYYNIDQKVPLALPGLKVMDKRSSNEHIYSDAFILRFGVTYRLPTNIPGQS